MSRNINTLRNAGVGAAFVAGALVVSPVVEAGFVDPNVQQVVESNQERTITAVDLDFGEGNKPKDQGSMPTRPEAIALAAGIPIMPDFSKMITSRDSLIPQRAVSQRYNHTSRALSSGRSYRG